jgi:hypothetical protein
MKKLESLKNSLFQKLENHKINNLAICLGGTPVPTQTQINQSGKDAYDVSTGHAGGSAIYFEPGTPTWADIYN